MQRRGGPAKRWGEQLVPWKLKMGTMWAPSIAKLVQIPISLWFMILITIFNGVYKPTNITGGLHIVSLYRYMPSGCYLISIPGVLLIWLLPLSI